MPPRATAVPPVIVSLPSTSIEPAILPDALLPFPITKPPDCV